MAILASEIATRLGFDNNVVTKITCAALTHDSDEVRTGDIPTPTKKRLRAKFGDEFDKTFDEFRPHDSGQHLSIAKTILKCADYLESILFLGENRVGRHAETVLDDIYEDALAYFDHVGKCGIIARQILSELENAVYEI